MLDQQSVADEFQDFGAIATGAAMRGEFRRKGVDDAEHLGDVALVAGQRYALAKASATMSMRGSDISPSTTGPPAEI